MHKIIALWATLIYILSIFSRLKTYRGFYINSFDHHLILALKFLAVIIYLGLN